MDEMTNMTDMPDVPGSADNQKPVKKPVNDIKQAVADAIARFREEFKDKSYSERHPELGKMLKCRVCLRRHRSSEVCKQVFATGTHDKAPEGEKKLLIADQTTRKGVYGAAQFDKKRVRPHHSRALLRLVQLTQNLFLKYYPSQIKEPDKAMHAARGEAQQVLRRQYKKRRKISQQTQRESRRINRSL